MRTHWHSGRRSWSPRWGGTRRRRIAGGEGEGLSLEPRLSFVTLGVDDLERSLAFYRDGLGLPTRGIVGREFEYGAAAFFELQGGLVLALWPRSSIARDTGLLRSPASATELALGPHVRSAGGVGAPLPAAEGAGRGRGSPDREAGRPGVLGRLRRVLPGSGRAPLGSGVESQAGARRSAAVTANPRLARARRAPTGPPRPWIDGPGRVFSEGPGGRV